VAFNLWQKYKYDNSKLLWYIKGVFRYFLPKFISQLKLQKILSEIDKYDKKYILERVNYYNKLDNNEPGGNLYLKDFKYILSRKKRGYGSAYFFDTYEYTRFFNDNLKISLKFGDVTYVPEIPSIVKSRPVDSNAGNIAEKPFNKNSILMKLDKSRHFIFLKDKIKFEDKISKLVSIGGIYQEHRKRFYRKYFDNPLCVLYAANCNAENPKWVKSFMTKDEQLKYKFILCLEGNDVSTNLKWVMSSNSLAVMTKPKFETWFMEGKLESGKHFVEIKDDYCDLEEKLNYYAENKSESLKIIDNANKWSCQFKNKKTEKLISLLVLQKYFDKTKR
jgi:hypothetical protein